MEKHERSGSACKAGHDCCPSFYLAVERFTFDILKALLMQPLPSFSFAHHLMSASLCLLGKGGRCLFTTIAAIQSGSGPVTNIVRSVFGLALIKKPVVSQDKCQ